MAKKKTVFTLESNYGKVVDKVREKPKRVLNIVGQNLTKEIRATTLKSMFKRRTGILSKTLGYWARKKEGDLQIGFKMSIGYLKVRPGIIGKMYFGQEPDPIKPVVLKNAENIKKLIGEALDEIRKEKT
jgi:hypothetical protein